MYEKIKEIWQTVSYHIKYCGASTIVICGLVVAVIILCSGCKTTKTTINDKSEIRDSTSVKTELWQDSTIINKEEQTTEIRNDKEITKDNTTITFGQGGGTYNTTTGEATNVVGVTSNKESERLRNELNKTQSKLQETQTKLQSVLDSIANIDKSMDIESEVEETYQASWYWWLAIGLSVGALLMLIIVVVLRKYPATRWLLAWI
jgi:lipopolysaccharide export LptBFGC system permease protein LptF